MDVQEIVAETKEQKESDNKINDEEILNLIQDYSNKNIIIITNELEEKIPFILSYLQNENNKISNKLDIIKYLNSLIKNIPYNTEILLVHKSTNDKQKMDLYKILIEQFIYTDKGEKEYIKYLEEILNMIFTRLSYNKELYRDFLEYISKFLNGKNNKNISEGINLNEYNYYQLLHLIYRFYQSKKDEKPINYYFFNGDKNTNITINNENKNLDLAFDLYILFFIKLIDYEYLSKLFESDKNINTTLNLIQINFQNKLNNININIDYKNTSITTDYNEKLTNINIPYNLFNQKEINNVLIKLTTENQLGIYIGGKDINISKNSSAVKNTIIENIIFSGEIYGMISTIMIYNDKSRNKINNLLPNCFLEKQSSKNDDIKYVLSSNFKDGFDEEILLVPFIKADINDKISIKNIFDTSLYNNEMKNNPYNEELNKFMIHNLISLYIPTRMYSENENGNKKIILVDSNNKINAKFNINELYENLTYSKYGGIRLLKNILVDFSVDLNGINHLLPCVEIMTNYPELLTSDNLSKFMSIILNLFTNFKQMISSHGNSNFFSLLSQFLEKIPEKRNNDLHAFIKTILITLQSFETEINENKIFTLYIQDFFNNVCMNEKILFKFNHEERSLIYQHIHQFLINEEQKNIDINIANIIKILLRHEENKYTHFCCKKHSQYFNKESKIMEPELKESIKPILNIIKILFNQYFRDIKNSPPKAQKEIVYNSQYKLIKLFEILTFDITPCLQHEILKLYFEFFNQKNEKYFESLNINDNIILITLFVIKTSLFDIKEIAFNYLIEPLNKKKNSKYLQEQLAKNITYYYYPRSQTNKNIQSYPKSIKIDGIIYQYEELNENQKQLIENYDRKHYNELILHIFDKSKEIFLTKKSQGYFNILLAIAQKCNSDFIFKFLFFVKEELNKKDANNINHAHAIKNNQKLLPFLLDTCYQAYLIKHCKEQKLEFIPGFDLDNIPEEQTRDQFIDNILSLSSNILRELFTLDVYKFDFLMTWCKYYYTIEETENKYKCVRKFIFDYFFKIIIKKVNDDSRTKTPCKFSLSYRTYLINIIFEYFAYNRTSGFENMGKLKEFESLYAQLCPSFSINLFMDIQKEEKTKEKTKEKIEEDSIYLLHEKWDEYDVIKILLDNSDILFIEENLKLKEEKKIFINYICDKENRFNDDLRKYFIKVNENDYFKNNKNNFFDCNKGMELAIVKYHYYTMVLNIVTNFSQFKDILNNLRYFILVIIISSTTATIYNPKNANAKNQKDFWPNELEYKRLQHLVKNILFNTISFLKDKIVETERKLDSYKSKMDDANVKSNYENYSKIKHYLINSILIIFKVLRNIFKHVEQKEISKRKNSTFKNIMSKLKGFISPDKEGIHLTGSYLFINEFITSCIKEQSSYENNESDKITTTTTFLDDIPDYSLSSINEVGYVEDNLCKQLEKIYNQNISNNQRISDYLSMDKDRYQRDLFPFVQYIIRRSGLICSLIPTYDNSCNFKFEYNYLCIKPYYHPLPAKDFVTFDNINMFSNELIQAIRMYQIEQNFNSNNKIRQYRKIKKKLFSFNGIFSTKKYFYDKKKYICKYKLLDHMTEDYTRIFLTPIMDMDYYLPKFSKFEIKNLFRSQNKNNLIQIHRLTNLCLLDTEKDKDKEKDKNEITQEKKEENNESQNYNELYLLRKAEYKYMDELNKDIEGSLSHYKSYRTYIENKQRIKKSYHHSIEDCCYVKSAYHIRGFFYINDREIGFYSYDKIPYKIFVKKSQRKNENESTINPINCTKEESKQIDEIQKDYDVERKCCFGSIFSPQSNKYDYLHFSIPYDQIVFILKRRYYYKVSCLEVFTTDKRTYFFKLDHTKLNTIITKIKHHMNPKPDDILIENKKFYQDIGFINYLSEINNMNKDMYKKGNMNLKGLYEKWKKWEISSLQLIMQMNLYANRTFNDMNQYPVFPWVFLDYKSETFPENFSDKLRPLDTPMGMLEINDEAKERRKEYLSHWEISRDSEGEEEENNYDRYGSHYSTSLYVSYYLVRIFPFAHIRIELQGTSFDDPNRLFNSIQTSFNCSSTQKSDLRELIPELFCCPEILVNDNDFNLGEVKDDTDPKEKAMKLVQECVTPKWSKNNAYMFIKKQRELLESYEVSVNINKWFNLIFGSKQKGPDANKIHNLFAAQSYEDYESTYDEMPSDEKDVSCRMLEFGVTPNQIFKNDTSQRKVDIDKSIKNKIFYNTLLEKKNMKNTETNIKTRLNLEEIKFEIKVKFNPDKIFYFPKDNNYENIKKNVFEIFVMNNDNLNIYLRKNDKIVINKEGKEQKKIISDEGIGNEEFEEISIKTLESKYNDKIKLINAKHGINNNLQPIHWLNNGSILVKGGYWNGNIILQNLVKDKENNIIKKLNANNNYIYTTSEFSPVMTIVFDKNETFAFCGNTNGTLYIFRINKNNKLNWTLYKTINDHNSPLISIAINETLNIAITCSQNGLCMLYTLPYFRLYNSFIIGKDDKDITNDNEILSPDIVLISDTPLPCFVFYINNKKTLYFYSINGKLLSKHCLNYELNKNAIKIYRDYQFVDYLVLYNCEKKHFEIRSMIEFELISHSPALNEFDFIDFTFSLDLEHMLVFGKNNEKYKLYVIYDNEVKINWK